MINKDNIEKENIDKLAEDAASVQGDSDADAPDDETTDKVKKRRPLVKVLTGILCACLIAAVIVLGYAA